VVPQGTSPTLILPVHHVTAHNADSKSYSVDVIVERLPSLVMHAVAGGRRHSYSRERDPAGPESQAHGAQEPARHQLAAM
jgi:hypothetical protein